MQGVGFRFFTQREAQRLGLCGFVRNRPDGSVEAEATGAREDLERFVDVVQRGPGTGRVTRCTVDWVAASDTYEEFTIRP